MSEESLAHKNEPASAQQDTDYDLIYATVSETAQGRRFLEEYARRCRSTETETSLAALERMEAVVRGGGTSERLEILLEMADMAQAIVRLRAEILAMRPPGAGALEATEELDSIVQTTECATSRILAAAEQVQEIAWSLRESGWLEGLCDELDNQATEIYTACTFQDLTGQRTRKVIEVLRFLEDRINSMVTARDKRVAGETQANEDSAGSDLLQADVDAMMQPENSPPDDRQDATLEDISRVMLAIEPTIGRQQAPAEEPPPPEDVRPELSVAETVTQESEQAHGLADWAVQPPAAPAEPAAEEMPPMADWIVEDPSAPQPQPDSEPAWMILRRLEAELDEQAETREPAATTASPPLKKEPPLFAAAPMAQLARKLQPDSLLPPAELFRPSAKSLVPLAELEMAIAAAEMNLLLPGEDTETAAAPSPAADPAPAAPAAAPVGKAPRAETDADDFPFAPEKKSPEPATPKASQGAPAPVTPETSPPESQADEPKSEPAYDPLAPLRALSDAEKIALFS